MRLMENTLSEMAKLYAPFDEFDEHDLALQMVVGDEEAKLELIQHNARFALKIVNSFKIKDKDLYEDAQSAALIGLLKGLKSYNPDSYTRISTYCYKFVWGEVWTTLANAKVANSIPTYMYVKIASFVKAFVEKNEKIPTEQDVTDFLIKRFKLDEFTASQISVISHSGVMKFNDLRFADGEETGMVVEDMGNSVFSPAIRNTDPSVRLALSEIADRVEEYCKNNLTKKQFKVIDMIIINYLRNQEVCTIKQASEKLFCHYQAVDQLLRYSLLKLGVTEEGAFVKRAIKCVLEMAISKENSSYA